MYLEWREVRTARKKPKKGIAWVVHHACSHQSGNPTLSICTQLHCQFFFTFVLSPLIHMSDSKHMWSNGMSECCDCDHNASKVSEYIPVQVRHKEYSVLRASRSSLLHVTKWMISPHISLGATAIRFLCFA